MAETRTVGQSLKKYGDGDNPGAANLNFNWDTIDTRLVGVGSSFPDRYPVTGLFLLVDRKRMYENVGTVEAPVWRLKFVEVSRDAVVADSGGIPAKKLVYQTSNSRGSVADAMVRSKMPVIGYAEEAIAEGFEGEVVNKGEVESRDWSFVPGRPVFAGAAGEVTQDIAGLHVIQKLGWAKTATVVVLAIKDLVYRVFS